MKVMILAGGYGSRLSEYTEVCPKPMVEIGGKPILWHIMKIYAYYGFNEFVICLGYKANFIKNYFHNYMLLNNDFTVKLDQPENITVHKNQEEDWKVTLVDTGVDTLKGGRIKRAQKYIDDDLFLFTYGDGLADIDLNDLLKFHKSHGKIGTITAVRPPSRFGELVVNRKRVTSFSEKPQTSTGLINGGFCIFDRKLFEYLSPNEDCDFENDSLERLAADGELMAYEHTRQWECMDTVRDLKHLNKLWREGNAFWKVWE